MAKNLQDTLNLDFAQSMAAVAAMTEKIMARDGEKPKAYILTFGCQQNEADSEKLAGMAEAMGYEMAPVPDDAELILVNTCAIREHAEKRALSMIGQFKHLKEARPSLVIGVMGCMTAQEHRSCQLKMSYPYVDFAAGTAEIQNIPALVLGALKKQKRRFDPAPEYGATAFRPPVFEGIPVKRESSYKAWVSVMYGCDNFCSYCIVPYVRGRERSRSPEAIYEEVRTLAAEGCRDITLLGQNVNSYGKGLPEKASIASLLASLAEIEGEFWLRFMTSHPKDVSDELIEVMAKFPKIAPHFHLPLQSGSNWILAQMNRKYTIEKYMTTLEKLREAMPDITLTTDIIVGFPGETEEDFEATLDALRRSRYDMIYSFIYSPRKGTPAAEMEEQIPDAVKSERFDRLLKVQNEISFEKNNACVGKVFRCLGDGQSKNDSAVQTARTAGNKIVHFTADADMSGQFIDVKITRADTFALYGEIIKK